MRTSVIIGWVFALLTVASLHAQEVPAEVTAAFKKGDASGLAPFLGDKVDLIIQNRSTRHNRQTGEKALATFFSEHKVTGYALNHQGKRDESSFVIGTLTTTRGNFRVTCFFKRVENSFLIHQIRIDTSNE
ncbi:MAG: DUF4783 domain-containing protein [Bacteroides sp.]|nr:DUF4783 domain-containing protein [Bacteroides sp.]